MCVCVCVFVCVMCACLCVCVAPDCSPISLAFSQCVCVWCVCMQIFSHVHFAPVVMIDTLTILAIIMILQFYD